MLYNFKWSLNSGCANSGNGIYDFQEATKIIIEDLSERRDESEWEQIMWSCDDGLVVPYIKTLMAMEKGDRLYIPYCDVHSDKPEVLLITAMEERD